MSVLPYTPAFDYVPPAVRISLTPRCAELLRFIEDRIKRERVAPSYDEMRAHMKISSKSCIARMIATLRQRNHIRTVYGRRRAIELVSHRTHCPHCGEYLGSAR